MSHVTVRAQAPVPLVPSDADAPEAAPEAGGRPRPRVPLMFGALLGAAAYWSLPRPATAGELRITGLISANEVTVSARATGRIMHLRVGEGDEVAAGSTVATLDRDELEAAPRRQLGVIAELAARLGRSQEIVALESRRAEGQIARARAELSAAHSRRQQASACA